MSSTSRNENTTKLTAQLSAPPADATSAPSVTLLHAHSPLPPEPPPRPPMAAFSCHTQVAMCIAS